MKDDDSEQREKERKQIENYVSLNNITVQPSANGLYFIPQTEGTGPNPTSTEYAIIKYKATDLEGNLMDCTDKALAEQKKVTTFFALGGPLKINLSSIGIFRGVSEGVMQMKEGGKAKMIMPSILAYNDYIPVIFEVELVKIIHNPMAYEKEQIKNYLDTATTKEVKDSTASGLYYIKRTPGTGTTNPFNGQSVKIKYTGFLPDGRIFDKTAKTANDTTTLLFKVGNQEVINGLDDGIRLMTKGEKATFVLPYYRAYGFDPLPNRATGQTVIPYFSTLIFDVELVDVI